MAARAGGYWTVVDVVRRRSDQEVAMTDQVTERSKTEEAKEVARQTTERAGDVVGEVTEQAKVVARDAKDHARQLFDQGRQHLDEEARNRSRQAAGGLRTLADQLSALSAGNADQAGALGDYARQGREQLSRLADRLDEGPSAVLDDVRRFARRQPVVFLAAAGALGFVAGRLVRGARDAGHQQDGASGTATYAATGAMPPPDVPPIGTVPPGAARPPIEATTTVPAGGIPPLPGEALAP
jgi:hypothetical protein